MTESDNLGSPTSSPAPSRSVRSRPSLSCLHCDLKFSRPSHLTRHMLSHLPDDQRDYVSCSKCGKKFARNDVLLRHLRISHQIFSHRPRSAQKSCHRCAEKKLKCNRHDPCHGCIKSRTACSYPAAQDPRANELSPLNSQEPVLTDSEVGPGHHQSLEFAGSSWRQDTEPASTVQGPHGVSGTDPQFDDNTTATIHTNGTIPHYDTAEIHRAMAVPIYPQPNAISMPIDALYDGAMSLEDDGNDLSGDPMTGASQFSFSPMPFGGSTQDWLDLDPFGIMDDFQTVLPSSTTTNILLPNHNTWSVPNPSQVLPSVLRDQQPHPPISSGVLPIVMPTRPASPNIQPRGQPWPFEQAHDAMQSTLRLPPLRDMLRGSCRTHRLGKTTMEAVAQLLSGPLLPNVDDLSDDPNATAAFHLLRRAVDAFFAHFCAVLPIVHVPTWDILKTSTALIAAMACIGSIFVDSSDAWDNSLLLSEICSYVIVWQGESDAASYQDASYLSACCLHQIYSLGSGNRSLYQSADRKRGLLIGSLRGIGVLRSRLSIENDEPDQNHTDEARAEDLHARWQRWRDVQQGRRLAWASFEYDCSLCTLTNRRGAVDMSELPAHLPCTDALWQASSAAAWKALYSQSSPAAKGPPQASLLRELLSAGTFPWDLPSWSKRLCSQIIGRLLWDIKQMELVWIYDYLGLSSLRSAQKQTSASLLNALSHLSRSMTRASTTGELIDNNISRLIYHYSHLYTAGDILDLVIFIVRSSATTSTSNTANKQSPQKNSECHLAKSRLTSKLAYDQCKTRKLVWHAAQIIAVADEYVVSAPCEILRVSMGYLFIMAFARFGTHPQKTTDVQDVESVKLDNLRPSQDQQEAMSRWIEDGGSASLASIDNLCSEGCIGALNEQAQGLLSKLRNWGLVDKFSKILDAFQSCED